MKLDPTAFIADPELIQGLQKRATPISCDEDRVLFRQGELASGLFILDKGPVVLSMTSPSGKAIDPFTASSGSLLGLPALVGNEPYTLTAVAQTGARLSFLSREEFDALMRSEPPLSLKVLLVLASEVRSARNALRDR